MLGPATSKPIAQQLRQHAHPYRLPWALFPGPMAAGCSGRTSSRDSTLARSMCMKSPGVMKSRRTLLAAMNVSFSVSRCLHARAESTMCLGLSGR